MGLEIARARPQKQLSREDKFRGDWCEDERIRLEDLGTDAHQREDVGERDDTVEARCSVKISFLRKNTQKWFLLFEVLMDFSSQQSNGFGNGLGSTRKPSGNTRRIWTTREEKVLLAALKDLVAKGQKTDNGFRTGYLNKLEDALQKAFPGCVLQATPHITSKITTWLKHYSVIVSAKLLATGVGFNTTTCQLDCTDDQWDSIMKRDPNARLMRSMSWPLYEDLCEIFGQSRATGEAGVSHLRATTPPPSFSANIDMDEASNKVGDETQDESESPSGHAQTGESNDMGKMSSGRKRKTPLPADPMVCVVQNLCDTASNRVGEISKRIGHDQDMSTARKMIYSSVSKMNMLTLQEKLRATTLIARNAEDIDVFFSLPDTDRMEWVTMLLNGDI
ncbi:hypothetical protein ACS0TY_003535 [Phlomoides rotata]